jgi:hypothetical protein
MAAGMVVMFVAAGIGAALAAEPTPPRAGMAAPRTGTTQKFGSGTITHRTDGSSSQTRPCGSGSTAGRCPCS